MSNPNALTVEDIADVRAYEAERDEFRSAMIAERSRRRIGVGPHVTLLFESRDTIRYQIQEMARVERLTTNEEIEAQLAAYNPLIPGPGRVSATLFIELTSDAELREWLPKLVGIERSIELRLCDGAVISSAAEEAHAAQLTREEITAAVHYVDFVLSDDEVDQMAAGPVRLAVAHANYAEEVVLSDDAVTALLTDLRPT